MAKAVIVCGGDVSPDALSEINKNEIMIAADSGYAALKDIGITPNFVIGDFDSLGYVPEGAIVLPERKDDTDLLAAVKYALDQGYDDINIFGALGGKRFSHSVAALQTLCYIASVGAKGVITDGRCKIYSLRDGEKCFSADKTGHISVFAFCGEPKVTLKGLSYPLDNYPLSPNYPLGVSNAFIGEKACVSVKNGTVIIITEP